MSQPVSSNHQFSNPEASEIIKNDFYVDDLLTGAQTPEKLFSLKHSISTILKSASFELRKWLSNCPELLNNSVTNQSLNLDLDSSKLGDGQQETKTLGITWDPQLDIFRYTINMNTQNSFINKRVILSTISKVFDPLGLLSPVTITGKLIMQRLWSEQCSWDESLPVELHYQWQHFAEKFPTLNDIKIPRHVVSRDFKRLELHGFSDASEKAYGACIYIRSINKTGHVTLHLVCAKSRVAPLKVISLPRLELCGALLLSQTIQKVRESLNITFSDEFYWCDSTIALSWIQGHPNRWKTFVANRVSEIQDTTNIHNWRHISSVDNPADLITRGTTPHEIIKCKLWWNGPSCLHVSDPELLSSNFLPNLTTDLPELRETGVTYVATIQDVDIFNKLSSFNKLQRVMAWCARFKHNASRQTRDRITGALTVLELQASRCQLIKLSQKQHFSNEFKNLTKSVAIKGNLSALNPFIDKDGLIRVGGRLQYSNYSYNKKHPIILHSAHPLTHLIMRTEHVRLLHCGPRTLVSSVREQYWPTSAMNLAKKIVRQCVTCFRAQPKPTEYLMGNLPLSRISYSPPFTITGVDYAGPFKIKTKKSRSSTETKAYVCLFVCFATKAAHLELVSDLTTDNFIPALRRFTSRRDKPQHIYSDKGTNFVGARSEIQKLSNFLKSELKTTQFQNTLISENITWHFSPPRSPHFGGLWEAGVKSAKSHMKRVIGDRSLTFEEFCTILSQIEAVLNSRPLSPLSSDPNDITPLTPAHFLIGRSLTAIPDPDVTSIKENQFSNYQHLQRMMQHFWHRWNKEYVSELQTRVKWKRDSATQLKIGALVIVKDDHTPPMNWRLGRIRELHPGPDGIVRAVSVQFVNSTLKRPVKNLCVLPIPDD